MVFGKRVARATWLGDLVWVVAASALLLSFGVLPLQDLPDWVFQAQLLEAWVFGHQPADYWLVGAVPPNALATVAIGLFGHVVGVSVATWLLVWAGAVAVPIFARRLMGAHQATSPSAWLPFLFGLSYPLLHGNLNSVLALAIFLGLALALFKNVDAQPARSPGAWLSVGAPLLLYVTHGVAYAMWLGLVVLTPMPRTARAKHLLGLLPSALVFAHYMLAKPAAASSWISWGGASLPSWLSYKADTFYKQLAPLSLLDPFLVPQVAIWAMVAINVTFVVALLWLVALKLRAALRDRAAAPSAVGIRTLIGALLLGFLIAPKGIIGLVNPGERVVLPIVLLALSFNYVVTTYRPLLLRSTHVAIGLLAILQMASFAIQGHVASREMQNLIRDSRTASGRTFLVHESHLSHAALAPRALSVQGYTAVPRHYPLIRSPLYVASELGLTVPIFETGLFRSKVPGLLMTDLDAASTNRGDVIVIGEPLRIARIALLIPHRKAIARGTRYMVLDDLR